MPAEHKSCEIPPEMSRIKETLPSCSLVRPLVDAATVTFRTKMRYSEKLLYPGRANLEILLVTKRLETEK